MTMFEYRPVTKESQLYNKPVKLSQRQMGEISAKVDKQLKERSGGICERCRAARATERAHLIRRGKLEWKTTVNDLAHLCTPCHHWADRSGTDGRQWLKQYREKLLEAS